MTRYGRCVFTLDKMKFLLCLQVVLKLQLLPVILKFIVWQLGRKRIDTERPSEVFHREVLKSFGQRIA